MVGAADVVVVGGVVGGVGVVVVGLVVGLVLVVVVVVAEGASKFPWRPRWATALRVLAHTHSGSFRPNSEAPLRTETPKLIRRSNSTYIRGPKQRGFPKGTRGALACYWFEDLP